MSRIPGTNDLTQARRAFFERGNVPGADVPKIILQSWQRCRRLGLPAETSPSIEPIPDTRLREMRERNERLWRLARAELSLAQGGEDFRNRHSGRRLDLYIPVRKRQSQPIGQPTTDRRFAHPHQADQGYGAGRTRIRAPPPMSRCRSSGTWSRSSRSTCRGTAEASGTTRSRAKLSPPSTIARTAIACSP